MSRPMRTVVVLSALSLGLLGISAGGGRLSAQAPKLPERLALYLQKHAHLTPQEIQALQGGASVTKLMDSDPAKEVAVFGAVWIDAPPALYVAAVKDIERFERGGSFRVTKRISDPPRPEDFAAMDLPDEDLKDLRTCKVGACEIKLGEAALARVRKEIDWSKPTAHQDVKALVRKLAFDYVTAYLEGGNARLAVYRDAERPTFVAQEFSSMIDRLPALTEFLPEMRRYLLDFPKATLPNGTSFLYWQEAQFGLKATIRINHVIIDERPDIVTVASKQIYASHYFWTALELRVLAPDPSRGRGFYFVNVNRSRSDGLTGFVGRTIRGKVRNEARSGIEKALQATKAHIEQQARTAP
jgi:hypothetical protein